MLLNDGAEGERRMVVILYPFVSSTLILHFLLQSRLLNLAAVTYELI